MKFHSYQLQIIIIACFLAFSYISTAQEHQKGNKPEGRERPAIASVHGKVIDQQSRKPIEFATISIISKRDSSVETGGITNKKGVFNISEIRVGIYYAVVNFIGYQALTIEEVRLSPKGSINVDLGTIELVPSINELEDAEIVTEKNFVEFEIDKRVYSVDENITAEGGDVTEVLENIPSVEIDIDGNVTLRGSGNVTVLVDGKPSGLTGADREALLDQIPASSVEKIEVITNPSAKYDPEGMAGIINIVLKKNKLSGFHGTVKATLGTGENYNGSLGLNYRNSIFNLYSSYSYRYGNRSSEGLSERTITSENDGYSLNQNTEGWRAGRSHTAKLGSDIFINSKNTLSVSGLYSFRDNSNYSNLVNAINYSDSSFDNSQRLSDGSSESGSYDITLAYRKEFSNRDHFISLEAYKSEYNSDKDNLYEESELDATLLPNSNFTLQENVNSLSRNSVNVFQADYVMPLKNDKKFELGWKSSFRTMDSDIVFETLNDSSMVFENDILRSNQFVYNEDIHAVYSTFGIQKEKIGIQAGLRYESVFTNSELITNSETFENNYQSLYPSAHLSYSISKETNLQLSYSRRVNRPRTRQLNPFPNYSDPLNLRKGNPFLLPEYVNSIELTATKRDKKNTFSASIYYKGINDVIRRFKTIDSSGVATLTYENIDKAQSYGVELFAIMKLTKNWTLNTSGNAFETISDASNLESDLNSNTFGWSVKIMNTWKFGEGWNIQLTGKYRAPRTILQGRMEAMYYADLAIKKTILKNKGSISLKVRDLFNSRQFEYNTSGVNFEQYDFRKRESQNVYLSFSYKFGKLEEKKGKRGGRNGEEAGSGFDEMDY